MNTEPVKKLLRKYNGDLFLASSREIARVFKQTNGKTKEVIDLLNQAHAEYEKETFRREGPGKIKIHS